MIRKRTTHIAIIALILAFVICPAILNAALKSNLKDLIDDQNKNVVMTWAFYGGDMPAAEMFFWSNGLLVLDSQLFSNNKSKMYFTWKMSEDSNRLEISFIDSKVPFKEFLAVEKAHPNHIITFDESSKSITYRVIDHESIYFGNWLFEKK